MPVSPNYKPSGQLAVAAPTVTNALTAVAQFQRVFSNAIRLLVTKDEAELMVKNMIRIAKDENAHPAQCIAAFNILTERLEGKATPSAEELEASGVKVVVLPNYGQTGRVEAPTAPAEIVQDNDLD